MNSKTNKPLLESYQRFILKLDSKGTVVKRVEITNCFWCGSNQDTICTSCSGKLERA